MWTVKFQVSMHTCVVRSEYCVVVDTNVQADQGLHFPQSA